MADLNPTFFTGNVEKMKKDTQHYQGSALPLSYLGVKQGYRSNLKLYQAWGQSGRT
jgi:hypothetical protein